MTGTKCFQCGFVSARSNEVCKRCGASLYQTPANTRTGFDLREATPILIGVGVIVVIVLGLWLTPKLLSGPAPSPNTVSLLLHANDELTRPLVVDFPTEFSRQAYDDKEREDYVLDDYVEAQVLNRLGLLSVTFDPVKSPRRDCYRYRIDSSRPQAFTTYSDIPNGAVRDREGPYEHCQDVWIYNTKLEFADLDTVDDAAIMEKIPMLVDVGHQGPLRNRPAEWRGANVASTNVTVGSIEIVEISDPVAGQRTGTYSVGFKFRIKPNALGALIDRDSPVHRSLPAGIRQLFFSHAADINAVDRRLTYLVTGRGSDGLSLGHADLVREGIFNPQWKIAQVYLDPRDQTQYAYRRVE
jgi:hypothetical protein